MELQEVIFKQIAALPRKRKNNPLRSGRKKKGGPRFALFLLLAVHVVVTCIELSDVMLRDTDMRFKVLSGGA